MQRSRIVLLAVAAFALVSSAAAHSIAATTLPVPWRILLASDREGDTDIYRVDADGRRSVRLTRSPRFDAPSAVSPDGRRILFESNRSPKGDVWVMNGDGTGQRNLTRSPAFECCGSWSPDGRRIAFVSDRDGNDEIYVMNQDGGAQHVVAASPSSQEIPAAWSPDGSSIAFATDRDGNWEIYAMDADGGDPRNLTRNALSDGRDGGFAWSPDGRRIVFATNRDRSRNGAGKVQDELWVMNADGSGQQRLTRSPEAEQVITWSPDGRKIVFGRFPSTPSWAFFVMNADGTGVKKVDWVLPRTKP